MSLYGSMLRDSKSDHASSKISQNYDALKQICFATKTLFEDPTFSPTAGDGVQWHRPPQFCKVQSPKFIADGVSRFDVQQGGLGDCWLVAAMASLTLNRSLFDRVVPSDQSFVPGAYCGLFRFNFWRHGKWVEVVIDDRLPWSDITGKPLYVHSSDPTEFWSPLFEKAYAKLYSSFKALDGGWFCEAMVDFTGGLAECFYLQREDLPANLWTILLKGFERGSMIGCSILKRDVSYRARGLIECHAYSVTMVTEIQEDDHLDRMLRLRNPWGNKAEWNGAWSDRSAKWLNISESERKRIGQTVRDDGEFWMSFEDWKRNFTHCEMCNLTPESIDSKQSHRWFPRQFEGAWSWSRSAGGHRTVINAQEFATNPQYFVKLTDPDCDDLSGKCTLVLSLMHENNRSAVGGASNGLTIGFYIYAVSQRYVESLPRHLGADFFEQSQPIKLEPTFTMNRDLTERFHLVPGSYVIVPTSHNAGEEGEFLLRIWTEHLVKCVESVRREAPANQATPIREPIRNDAIRARSLVAKYATTYANQIQCMSTPPPAHKLSSTYNYNDYIEYGDIRRVESHHEEIRYPTLTYPGKPRIVNREVHPPSRRRAAINMRVGANLSVPQHPAPPKEHRSPLRKILGWLKPKPAKPKQRR